jgi:hypothetical protein
MRRKLVIVDRYSAAQIIFADRNVLRPSRLRDKLEIVLRELSFCQAARARSAKKG